MLLAGKLENDQNVGRSKWLRGIAKGRNYVV